MTDNEQVWEGRFQKVSDKFTAHPIWQSIKYLLLLVLIGTLFTIGGFVFHWFGTAAHVISPENVKQQYALAFQDYNSLKATAVNVCGVVSAEKLLTPGSDAWNQRESQRLAYEQNYARIKAQYEARMSDIFQAKKVKPAELPFTAPTLQAMEDQVC